MQEFWVCLMWYIAQGHCTNYRAVIKTELYSEDCETFKVGIFAKRIVPECWHAIKRFQSSVGLMGLGSFNKFSSKTKQKSYTIIQLNFELKIQPKDGHTRRLFSQKLETFFYFWKKLDGRRGLSSFPLAGCLWGWMNMDILRYPWISLNILENVLTMPGLWICMVILHLW